jgi:hypothetical protein
VWDVKLACWKDTVDAVEQRSKSLAFKVEFEPCEILTESDRCFSESSTVFTSEADREKAKVIALTYGKKIAKNVPLGYKDGQLLIVFHDNCPNNLIMVNPRLCRGTPKV